MLLLTLAAGPLAAAEIDHAAMGHGAPAVTKGPWSYHDRDNPRPHRDGRWEMVPVPGYGHMHLSTRGLSAELRCAALASPGVMVDRATRRACNLPERPAPGSAVVPAPVVDHSAMGH
jgi:hypothetical protein